MNKKEKQLLEIGYNAGKSGELGLEELAEKIQEKRGAEA